MKLLDLLVKELPKRGGWPDGVAAMAQDADGAVQNYRSTEYITIDAEHAAGISRIACSYSILPSRVAAASDRLTAIITREQYESALAASDSWIEWGGGECPVDLHEKLDVKYLGGGTNINVKAGGQMWSHARHFGDIIAYRLHKPDINSRANDDRLEQDLNECIGQPVPPIEWANSGLPLVGVTCEMVDENGSYKPVEIIAWRNECVIGWDSERLITYISNNPSDFRPLRTEAEKLREAAIQDLTSVICGNVPDTGMATAAMYAERVYDAGYRKESK